MIFIVSANINNKALGKLIKKFGSFRWAYFGKRTTQYYRINKFILPFGENIDTGKIINRVARDIRDEFINFDKNLDLGDNAHLWYATDLAERNPYASDFFYNCCILIALKGLLNKENNNLVLFIEDLYLSLLIKKRVTIAASKVKLFWYFKPFVFSRAIIIMSFMYSLYMCLRAVCQRIRFFALWFNRRIILAKYHRNIWCDQKSPEVLVTLWTDANTFKDKKYIYKETYFGPLVSYIQNSGKNLGYIAFPLDWVSKYKDIVKSAVDSDEPIVFPEECLSLFNVLYIMIFTLFYTPKLKAPLLLSGVDIEGLFFNEIKKEKVKGAYLRNLRFYFIGKYLTAQGINPKMIIHLYENQSWEKVLKLGIKNYFAQTEFIGYQHAPFPKLYLNYFPSQRDITSSKIPDKIITIGKMHEDIFLDHSYSKSTLRQGPALRFDYLFKRFDNSGKDNSASLQNKFILVAGSIGYLESFELVCKVMEALKDRDKYDIYIKLHPKMDKREKLISNILENFNMEILPPHIKFVNDSMENILPKAAVLFYNETVVSYEAVALNIPVVFFHSDIWLDMDELEWFGGAFYKVRAPIEILGVLSAIERSGDNEDKKKQSFSEEIVRKSFNPFSIELVKNFYY